MRRRYVHRRPGETGQAPVRLRAGTVIRAPVGRAIPHARRRALWEHRRMRRTVLIVDDHDAFRSAARALLEAGGFTVVGDVAGGRAAVAAARELAPDIILLDIELPDLCGFAVAERLAAGPTPPRVVLVSGRDGAAYRSRLRAARACGFLAKRELSGDALAALVG
jgi:DNA-binding NarL/FixJ family response regulator